MEREEKNLFTTLSFMCNMCHVCIYYAALCSLQCVDGHKKYNFKPSPSILYVMYRVSRVMYGVGGVTPSQ